MGTCRLEMVYIDLILLWGFFFLFSVYLNLTLWQIEFPCNANTDLLLAFQCDHSVSNRWCSYSLELDDQIVFILSWTCRYKYKFLRATTSNIPSSVLKDNRGSKVTIGKGGMLKIQHLVSVRRSPARHSRGDSTSHIAYIEFFVKPEEDDCPAADA